MKHDLATELKEAGFPQTSKGASYVDLSSKDSFYVPTLEELIEACIGLMEPKEQSPSELHFFELYHISTAPSGADKVPAETDPDGEALGKSFEWGVGWSRGSSLNDIRARDNYFGNTPNEAVALLWLALNKANTEGTLSS